MKTNSNTEPSAQQTTITVQSTITTSAQPTAVQTTLEVSSSIWPTAPTQPPLSTSTTTAITEAYFTYRTLNGYNVQLEPIWTSAVTDQAACMGLCTLNADCDLASYENSSKNCFLFDLTSSTFVFTSTSFDLYKKQLSDRFFSK
jgi:hypothetical protein